MPRSSESVAALASALAKAQAELTNPEKSLIATLPAERGRPRAHVPLCARSPADWRSCAKRWGGMRSRPSNQPRSTATAAPSSSPPRWRMHRRMDRLGLAGLLAGRPANAASDGGGADLRAPLWTVHARWHRRRGRSRCSRSAIANRTCSAAGASSPTIGARLAPEPRQIIPAKPVVILDFAASLQQRDELLGGLVSIASFDAAAEWAKSIIPVKNTLTAEHARDVEAALEVKLGEIGDPFEEPLQISETPNATPSQGGQHPENGDVTTLATVDRSTLTIGHTPRRRNKAHLKFVATQPCLLCGRQPSDPHHLKFAQVQALGRKVSDEFTVPLCRTHHRELHNAGSEVDWWEAWDRNVDPLEIAKGLWEQSLNRASQSLPVLSASQVLIRD